MSYYQFNKQEILQKAEENYSKEKAAKDYLENKEAIAKRSKIGHKNMTELGEKRISRNYLKKLKPYEDEILPVKQKKIAEKSP